MTKTPPIIGPVSYCILRDDAALLLRTTPQPLFSRPETPKGAVMLTDNVRYEISATYVLGFSSPAPEVSISFGGDAEIASLTGQVASSTSDSLSEPAALHRQALKGSTPFLVGATAGSETKKYVIISIDDGAVVLRKFGWLIPQVSFGAKPVSVNLLKGSRIVFRSFPESIDQLLPSDPSGIIN